MAQLFARSVMVVGAVFFIGLLIYLASREEWEDCQGEPWIQEKADYKKYTAVSDTEKMNINTIKPIRELTQKRLI